MILNKNILQLDIKLQTKYRELLSKLGNSSSKITCISLGDSDIDYSLGENVSDARILNAPYQAQGIKHKLLYNGIGKGLSGYINSFARFVDSNGKINSLYNYPTTNTLSPGRTPPILENAFDWNQIQFDDTKMGVILFFESILDYYFDSNGQPEKFLEDMSITVLFNGSETVPSGWEVTKDLSNRSILISKTAISVSSLTLYPNQIIVKGLTTGNIKTITFNS